MGALKTGPRGNTRVTNGSDPPTLLRNSTLESHFSGFRAYWQMVQARLPPKPEAPSLSPEPRHTRDSVLVLVVDRCYKALHALLVGPAGQADISLSPLKAWHVKPFIKPNHDETV